MLLFSWWELTYHISIAYEIARVTKWWQADLFCANSSAIMQMSIFLPASGYKELWWYTRCQVYSTHWSIPQGKSVMSSSRQEQWCNINGGFGNHCRLERARLRGLQFGEKGFADWRCCPGLLGCVCVCVHGGWHLCMEYLFMSEAVCAKPFTASVYSLFEGVWFSYACLSSIFFFSFPLSFSSLFQPYFPPVIPHFILITICPCFSPCVLSIPSNPSPLHPSIPQTAISVWDAVLGELREQWNMRLTH